MLLLTMKDGLSYRLLYECYMIGMHKVSQVFRIGGKYKDVKFSMIKHCPSDGQLFLNLYSYYPWYVFFFRFRNPAFYNYEHGDVIKHEGVTPL